MGATTVIAWADATWNPWYGCVKVSPGCQHCYMDRWAARAGKPPRAVTRSKTRFRDPLRWAAGRSIFTCSLSDFFLDQADPWRPEAWDLIAQTPHHTYLILTKRPERIRAHLPAGWPFPHVWLGVSIESPAYLWRADVLRTMPAAGRFLSCEPLLAPLGRLDLSGIGGVIVGGESGPRHRPMEAAWVRAIRDQCLAAGVAFCFKQWGGRSPNAGGHVLDGRTWLERPWDTPRAGSGPWLS